MAYKSMLTTDNIRSYIERLAAEEGYTNDHLIKNFLALARKIDIRISDGIKHEEVNDNGTISSHIQYSVIVSRKYSIKARKVSLVVHTPQLLGDRIANLQPDLSDVLLQIRIRMSFVPDNFEKYCEEAGKTPEDPASKADYRKEIKTARALEQIFSEQEMTCLPLSSSLNDILFDEKTVIWINIFDYNKLTDLEEHIRRYEKLLSQYGYDPNKDQWDTKRFPVTQTDRQMEGIKSDIDRSRKAVEEYNLHLEYLARKYDVDIKEEGYIFLPLEKS